MEKTKEVPAISIALLAKQVGWSTPYIRQKSINGEILGCWKDKGNGSWMYLSDTCKQEVFKNAPNVKGK